MFMSVVFVFLLPAVSEAAITDFAVVEKEVSKKCNYVPNDQYGKTISYQTANCLLTNIAIEMEVPAEIVKGVATQEKGNWQQFENGNPFRSDDNGYGIMQMTSYDKADEERIMNNAIFNIYSGVKRLKENFISPYIQKDDPSKFLEKWYFSVLRYNGNYRVNGPVYKCDEGRYGTRNTTTAYQEKVYKKINEFQYINTNIHLIPFSPDDFTYDCNIDRDPIKYNVSNFQVNGSLTETKHLFNENDTLITVGSPAIRKTATKDDKLQLIASGNGIVVKPTGEFVYDLNSTVPNRFVWYPVQLQDSRQGYVSSSYLKRVTTRLSGINRYETAAEISKEGWKQSDTVVIATGQGFPDALSGAPLASKFNAPLLLVSNLYPSKNNVATKNEIGRLNAKKAIILGGNGAVPLEFEKELLGLGLTVTRISGSDRYATSAKIAENLSSDTAILATGSNFADAISVAAYASKKGHPILLTKKDVIPSAIKSSLLKVNKSIVIGGQGAVSNNVLNQLPNPKRYSGSDRYETNKIVVEQLNLGHNEIFAATGKLFPDALSGAALAAKNNAPILLVKDELTSKSLIDSYQAATILGGEKIISPEIEIDMINLLKN